MNLLITAEEALEQLGRPRLPVVIDSRSEEEYRQGHLPGAIRVDTWELAPEETTMSGLFDFNTLLDKQLRVLGRFEKVDLILYGDGFDRRTLRQFWLFHYAGQLSTRLLTGGVSGFVAAGGKLTESEPDLDPCPVAVRQRREVIARYDELEALFEDEKTRIIDTRAPEAFEAFHLPGALNLPAERLASEGRLLAPEEILSHTEPLGIEGRTPLVLYSERGASSAMAWTALRSVGFRKARSFFGGLEEWRRHHS